MIERNDPCWCGSGKKYKKCHLSSDEEKRVPPKKGVTARASAKEPPKSRQKKSLQKTPAQIDGMRRSGAFNGRLLDYIRPFVAAGAVTDDLNTLIHNYTVENGHIPACLGYKGHKRAFPKSCCISRNDVVCHGIPSKDERVLEGDIVNIDLTTIVDGFHGDSSETFMIGAVSKEARHLVGVAAKALIIGIDAVKPGAHLRAIGDAIEPFVNAQGCSVVQQYTGHGIGLKFHESFSVYHHIEPRGEDIIMLPGMTFTIEPMINLGGYAVTTDWGDDGWTVRTEDGSLSAQFEHTVLVTDSGAEVLTLTPSQRAAGVRLIVDGEAYR
ncbi:MAG: methionyl aminopeptidase [Chitinispirillales bacterium]|jgi:methionyl aminopeptidase|nr:methionyl aminopeptidase [Chitinispirillales bacterium]